MPVVETVVPIALFVTLAFVFVGGARVIVEGRIRRRLIEINASPELARVVLTSPHEDPGFYGTLKWAAVTGAVGLALIVVQFLPYNPDDPIVLGLLLVSVSAGLFAYYLAARRLSRSAG